MDTRENDRFEPILLLEEWIASGMGSSIANETLSYACLLISDAMINHDYESLSELKNRLTPLAAKISRRLQSLNIPPAELQASGIPVMSSLVRAAFQYLEWNDPVSTLEHIRYGKEILAILIKNSLNSTSDKNDSFILNLPSIEKILTKNQKKLSQATISRCLKLLDQKAFIHLTGSTRSRKCHILHKSWQWYETAAKADEKKSVEPDMQDTEIDWTNFSAPVYIENEPPSVEAERPFWEKEDIPRRPVNTDFDFQASINRYREEAGLCGA